MRRCKHCLEQLRVRRGRHDQWYHSTYWPWTLDATEPHCPLVGAYLGGNQTYEAKE